MALARPASATATYGRRCGSGLTPGGAIGLVEDGEDAPQSVEFLAGRQKLGYPCFDVFPQLAGL
jgi:hypothetical protein